MAYVIGVAAQAQMGKDTLADRLQEKLNEKIVSELTIGTPIKTWQRAAFAANVKRVFEDTFDVDREFTEEWKVKLGVNPPGFDMPVRNALQFIGDGFRKIKSSIWIDLCFRDHHPKIISDVRYVNEFARIKAEGGLNILIGRPDKLNEDSNGSEAQIRPYIDWALKNFEGSFVDLSRFAYSKSDPPPEHFEKFDVFIRNDKSKEEFYEVIENKLVDFVSNFTFDFPEEETPCLISN